MATRYRKRAAGRHQNRVHQRQPYGWLGAGVLTLGVGAVLAGGTGTAHADTGGSDGQESRPGHTGRSISVAPRPTSDTAPPRSAPRSDSAARPGRPGGTSGSTAGMSPRGSSARLFPPERADGTDSAETPTAAKMVEAPSATAAAAVVPSSLSRRDIATAVQAVSFMPVRTDLPTVPGVPTAAENSAADATFSADSAPGMTPAVPGYVVGNISPYSGADGFPLPANPLAPLFAAVSGVVREVEAFLSNSIPVANAVPAATSGAEDLPRLPADSTELPSIGAQTADSGASATAEIQQTGSVRAAAVVNDSTEAEREQSDAEFNLSIGWVPVVGTVFNALSLATDVLEFSVAVMGGDVGDMLDEITDMAIDVIAMIPVVGAPLAAAIYNVRVALSTQAGLHAGIPAYTISAVDPSTGVVSGIVNVVGAQGGVLAYSLASNVDPVVANVSIDSGSGAFVFAPTQATRYQAAVLAGGDSVPFTVNVADGDATLQIVVDAPVSPLHPDDDGVLDLADLDTLAALGAIGVSERADGAITAIVGNFTDNKVTSASGALEELNRLAGVLGADGAFSGDISTQTTGFDAPTGGVVSETFYRLAQTVNGIPVIGSQVVLSTLADGTPTGVFNGVNPAIYSVNTTPASSFDTSAEVISTASGMLLGRMRNAPTGSRRTAFLAGLTFDQRLVVYALDPDAAPTLAWAVDIHTADSEPFTDLPVISTTYYIGANGTNTGALLAEEDGTEYAASPTTTPEMGLLQRMFRINVTQDGGTSLLVDTVRAPGVSVHLTPQVGGEQTLADSSNIITKGSAGWDKSGVSALGNIETVYDYYLNKLHVPVSTMTAIGRVGSVMESKIEVGVVENGNLDELLAAWSGDSGRIYFSVNTEAALDVVGHEFTHAVIQTIFGLGGIGPDDVPEAAALDEAYGDIIGSLIEGKDGDDRWKIGEDCGCGKDGGPIRDMRKVIDGTNKHDMATKFDRAAYLMMTDDRTVGVSKQTWAQIFYGSLYRLPRGAKFQDARNAVIAAASVQGLPVDAQKAIADAFDSVGISTTPRIKIVLTWGATPSDLDSHLTGPSSTAGGSRFHVYYSQRDYFKNGDYSSANTRLSVDLDYDDTTSYGPESTSIRNLVAGDYYFYVHDFSDKNTSSSTAMSDSGATVTVYLPGQSDNQNLLSYLFGSIFGTNAKAFHVDTSSEGTLWTVFKLSISASDPNHPTITAINRYTYESTPSYVGQ